MTIVFYVFFIDFRIRIEHLRCDLNGWSSQCATDVLGLKTEYECRLIQQHCKNLQVASFKNICNDNTYAKSSRQSGGLNNQGGTPPGGAGSTVSASVAAIFGSLIAVILAVL